MRILQITEELPPAVLGGAGRIAWETAVGLKHLGHEVHILTAADQGTFPAAIDNVPIHTIRKRPKRWAHWRSVFSRRLEAEVRTVIDTIKPDLIHIHGVAWQIGYRWIKPTIASGIPCIYTAHGVMSAAYGKVMEDVPYSPWSEIGKHRWEMNPLRNRMIVDALNRCSAIVCVSDALKTFLAKTGLKNLTTIHNGIDLDFWKQTESRTEARKALGLESSTTIFLFAGRIGHDKGSTALDDALPEDALLVVAGSEDPRGFPKTQSRVRFFPHQSAEQMKRLYTAVDAVIVPSIYLDPFPTVCLEAMAMSRAVVATCFGGSREAVMDGITGRVVDPRNVNVLREALQRYIAHPDECVKHGDAGRTHMEKNFSRPIYRKNLLEVYERARSRS